MSLLPPSVVSVVLLLLMIIIKELLNHLKIKIDVFFSKIVRRADREKLLENIVGVGERRGSGAYKHDFQHVIPVNQLLVYPTTGQL